MNRVKQSRQFKLPIMQKSKQKLKAKHLIRCIKFGILGSVLISVYVSLRLLVYHHDLSGKEFEQSIIYWPTLHTITVTKDPIISFTLIHGLEYNNTFDPYYICGPDRFKRNRISTHRALNSKGNTDFQVKISTSLKIIIIGDSVGIQFSQALQEATGAHPTDRHVIKYSWRKHEGVHLASPVLGGGAVAGFRITGMLKEKQKDNRHQLAPTPGGGWMSADVKSLNEALAHSHNKISTSLSGHENEEIRDTREKGNFDVAVFQFPFGWMEKPVADLFTFDALMDAINTCHAQFGAKTVILQTVGMQNNVIDLKSEIVAIYRAIYTFSNTYEPPKDGSGVQKIIVMDVAWLSLSLFAHNAVGLNMVDGSTLQLLNKRDADSAEKLADRLNPLLSSRMDCCNKDYQQVVGFSCAEDVDEPQNTKYCKMNTYSLDGMHWCMVSSFGSHKYSFFTGFRRKLSAPIFNFLHCFRIRWVDESTEQWDVSYGANMSIIISGKILKNAKIDAMISTCR